MTALSGEKRIRRIVAILVLVGLGFLALHFLWPPIRESIEASQERAAAARRERARKAAERREAELEVLRQQERFTFSEQQSRKWITLAPHEQTPIITLPKGVKYFGWRKFSACVDLRINQRYWSEDCPEEHWHYISEIVGNEPFKNVQFTAREKPVKFLMYVDYREHRTRLNEESTSRRMDIQPGEVVFFEFNRHPFFGTTTLHGLRWTTERGCVDVFNSQNHVETCPGETGRHSDLISNFKSIRRIGVRAIEQGVTFKIEAGFGPPHGR